jgi:DNA ligase-associated metallophosphoesterase
MTAVPLRFAGHDLLLDPLGAVVWPASGLLAVADLHLEKGSAAAANGSLVPPWDTAATLDRLARLIARWQPTIVVALGDSFHDTAGFDRMDRHDAAQLQAMGRRARFVWVLGNHDPEPAPGLAGTVTPCWRLGDLAFCHQARPGHGPELVGHHHPKASIATRAGTVTRPCFVADANRLMLPALGAFTGGLDIASPAIANLFPRGGRAYLLGQGRLFSFSLGHAGVGPAVLRRPADEPEPIHAGDVQLRAGGGVPPVR